MICLRLAEFDIQLIQSRLRFNKFAVQYGDQIKDELSFAEAAMELGTCIMRSLAGQGRLDDRTERQGRLTGDRRPYFAELQEMTTQE